ncbi:MAG TPA: TetR/AcrR family transcriptional regulator [Caulobacteraceae bacterium]|nr:TetR/AcrR family transcriptional regulator [Caulobacteraceae bacterium]
MSRREEAKEERRRRIITAARDLIRETGDAGLSMRAIASRAQVSLSTPYNLFGSKRAILIAVLEDIREFHERFSRLRRTSAIERIFQALRLSIGFYVEDPDFYRTLWTGMFDLSGKEVRAALDRPERDAFWLSLVEAAAQEGALLPQIDSVELLRDLDLTFAAVMMSWVLGGLEVNELQAAAGYGYALTLRGAATAAWQDRLAEKIGAFQDQMTASRQDANAA